MGQKVSPHGLRVGVIKDWDSKWYGDKKNFSDYLVEDHQIREYVKKKLYVAGVSKILIERSSENKIRVIILTAKDSELDKVIGLDQGADDYMTKPFSVLELTARIRSLLRRSVAYSEESHGFYDGGLEIDFDGRTVHVMQKQVDLTFKEFELLKYLILHKGKAVSRQELLNQIWGYDFVGESRTLDVHINSLRRKLGEPYDGWIQVIRGVGYRFVSEN